MGKLIMQINPQKTDDMTIRIKQNETLYNIHANFRGPFY